jgi:outer membrane protein OmpA-like peptidoglycan-associated protein
VRSKFQAPWANIADMMSGLMMIFLFISLVYSFETSKITEQLREKQDVVEAIAVSYTDNRSQIYESLNNHFSAEFSSWDATLDKDSLTVRFNDPELLFEPGSSRLTARFKTILAQFWSDYIEILGEYSDDIREIKIEGHTSSEWSDASLEDAYFNNMRLSQQRTRETLKFCYQITPNDSRAWTRSTVTANGMSSSRPILDDAGNEDTVSSRRVEFTVVVDSTSRLNKILGELND